MAARKRTKARTVSGKFTAPKASEPSSGSADVPANYTSVGCRAVDAGFQARALLERRAHELEAEKQRAGAALRACDDEEGQQRQQRQQGAATASRRAQALA